MTPQERDLITTLLDRLKSTAVPGQPKDPEADRLIRQAMRRSRTRRITWCRPC